MEMLSGDDFFKEIVEKAHSGIASHKADGTIIYINQYMADLMGYPRESIIGRSSLDFILKEDKESVIKTQNELKNKRFVTSERRIRRKDGSVLWTRVNLTAQVDNNGALTGYFATHTDITEQKKAEEAMVKSQENFHDLVESSGSIIMKADNELKITFMNDFGLKFFGYTSAELLGRNVLGTTIPKRDGAGRDLEEMVMGIKNNPQSFGTNVHQNMRRNGELVWVSWTNVPKYDKEGNLIEILAIGNDISKLIKTEEALRESQIRAEMLIKYAPIGIFELDYAGPKFLSVNDAMCQISGYSREELLSMNPLRMLDENSAINFNKRIQKILSGEILPENIEYKIRVKDGRELWVSLNVKIISDNGKSSRALVIAHDITQSKQLEEELKKYNESLEERVRLRSEEIMRERKRLYEVLETLPVYVILLDKDYRVPFSNKFFRERFGESHGKRCYEYLFNKTAECEGCETYKVMKTKAQHNWEWTGPDGRNYDIYDYPFYEADGSILILEMGIDVTEQKRAQKALIEANIYHRNLIEASLDPLVTISSEGKITDVNDATIKVTGSSREQLVGTDFLDYFTEPYKAREGYQEVFSRGFVTDYPLTIRHKDGYLTDVLYNASIYKDISGNVLGIFAAARDITASKKAEIAVQTERKRFYDVLETLPVMLCLLTPEYEVAFANQAFRKMFGESNGRPCYEYCHNKKEPCAFCESFRPLETGKSHHYEVSAPNGAIIDVYDFPFTDADGSRMILEMDIDITEKRHAEEKVKEQQEYLLKINEELVKSNKELESFAFITSHDLQEPLRMVTSYTQMLAMKYEDQLDENANEYINFAVSGAKRMYELINDLLDYSRISKKEISIAEVDINQIIETVKENLNLSITEKDCTIDYEDLPDIYADKSQMIRLFQNLISNGIKFSNNNPHIIISARTEESNYIISVKDNGIGIEPQYFDRIFEIFKRLNHREKFEGTGIGLAICKKIVENHNGKIWVESKPGKGSVFHFTIPIKNNG